MAVSAARAITGRPKILVFGGGYHGGVFYFRGHGSPLNAPFEFLLGRYNDLEALETLVRPHRQELAAILVEPMQGTTGCIPAERGFLAGLRALANETGALLIFDEVMTSRLAPGGLQEVHGIFPDLTTLGKYLGGGMSFGAFGGRAEIMERFDPRRPDAFQHAGTFNNNVLTMNAGLVGLTELYTPEHARALNQSGDRLRQRLNAVVRRPGLAMQFTGIGSMMSVHMADGPIRSEEDAARGNGALRDLFWFDLVGRSARRRMRRAAAVRCAICSGSICRIGHLVRQTRHVRAVDRSRRRGWRQTRRRGRGIHPDPRATFRSGGRLGADRLPETGAMQPRADTARKVRYIRRVIVAGFLNDDGVAHRDNLEWLQDTSNHRATAAALL